MGSLLFGIVGGAGGGCALGSAACFPRRGSVKRLQCKREEVKASGREKGERGSGVQRAIRAPNKPEHARGGGETGRRSRGGGVGVARHPRSTHIHLAHF